MPPVISIVGKSNSGKTLLLQGLVSHLQSKGYRIATIKHSKKFDLEAQGKDSWKLAEAGSVAVMLSSPDRVALIEPVSREQSLDELVYKLLGKYDLIFTESFKKAGAVKIEVHRSEQGHDLITSPLELFAVVTDEPLSVSAPQFSSQDITQLADIIEEGFLRSGDHEDEVQLFVNGSPIPMKTYVQDIVSRVVIAMISTLKGVDMDDVHQVDVRLRRG